MHFDWFFHEIFLFQAQKKELDHIRQEYHRKNSLARTPTSKREAKFEANKNIEEEDWGRFSLA